MDTRPPGTPHTSTPHYLHASQCVFCWCQGTCTPGPRVLYWGGGEHTSSPVGRKESKMPTKSKTAARKPAAKKAVDDHPAGAPPNWDQFCKWQGGKPKKKGSIFLPGMDARLRGQLLRLRRTDGVEGKEEEYKKALAALKGVDLDWAYRWLATAHNQ